MLRAGLKRLCKPWLNFTSCQESSLAERRRPVLLDVEQLEDRLTPSGLQILPGTNLAADTAGANYSTSFKASGGDGHYSYTLTSGALPSGLTLNSSTGVLSGKTTVAGSYSFSLKVTDTTRPTLNASQTFTLTVTPGAIASFTVSAPNTVTTGNAFSVVITAKDAYGNTVTSYKGSDTLTCSDGQKIVGSSTVSLTNGVGTAVITLNVADKLTITASSGSLKGTSGSITVKSAATSDWFSQNLTDAGLQALARTDFTRDHTLTYSDMLGLFAEVEAKGPVTTAEFQSLQALISASGTTTLHLTPDVQSLAYNVIDGNAANATYQGTTLGNLKAGSSATQLQELVNKWFLGEDHPVIDTQYIGSASYALASGTLFGSSGPSYQNVYQGAEGDCWLLASFGVTAANDPSVIQSMFISDGTTVENGVKVQVWTVRFYHNGVATYLTVDNYLPASSGYFDFANMGQSVSNPNNILWVPLAEKAYAQLSAEGWNQRPQSNSYAALDGGWASTVLPVLTGHAESATNSGASASSLISALSSGTLITVGSMANVASLGIVGGHDYAVLGYNASNQTFTLLNPWGWNTNYWYDGYTAGGMLHLTWSQLSQYYYLDGNCNPFHADAPTSNQSTSSTPAGAATTSPSNPSSAGLGSPSMDNVPTYFDMAIWQQSASTPQTNSTTANAPQSSPTGNSASAFGISLGSTGLGDLSGDDGSSFLAELAGAFGSKWWLI